MNKTEFEAFKDRLYRAENGLKKSLESCPDLEHTYIELQDGHKLFPKEIFSWLAAVRNDCWKHAPKEIRDRHDKATLEKQPRG